MSGSKTTYQVASSVYPLFDEERKADIFGMGILDYTVNQPMEYSEYMRQYYDRSRIRHIRAYPTWYEKQGLKDRFGNTESAFYGDSTVNNTVLTEALKEVLNIPEGDTFGVFNSRVAFFYEDFWIKYLATQQGKASLVYQDSTIDYEIEYPADGVIRAVFSNGEIVEGNLPEYTAADRFLEIRYSNIHKYTEEVTVLDPVTNQPVTKTVTKYSHTYGFYHYKENSGIPSLDQAFKDHISISVPSDFYSVIPLRQDTAWIEDSSKEIAQALKYLYVFGDVVQKEDSYQRMQSLCEESGSIDDIDFITLLLGVTINTREPAEQRYLFEFFYNAHFNKAVAEGHSPEQKLTPKNADPGSESQSNFSQEVTEKLAASQFDDSAYHSFSIKCEKSHFHFEYSWGGSDYFTHNGQFKPDAKVNDYGVLAGQYINTWTTYEPQVSEDSTEVKYVPVEHSETYNLTLFCHQTSQNRFEFVAFVDLKLTNHVYHGKTIVTDAYEAVKDSDKTSDLVLDLGGSWNGDSSTEFRTFKYVTNNVEDASPFLVPLEKSTFYELGVKDETQIAYYCSYLIFNCWEKKKKKWYQRGWWTIAMSFIGIHIPIVDILAWPMFTVALTAQAEKDLMRLCTALFGEKVGGYMYSTVKTVILAVVTYCTWGTGTALYAAATAGTMTAGESLNSKDPLWKVGSKGAISFAASYASSIASQAGTGLSVAQRTALAGVTGFTTGTTSAKLSGASTRDSLIAGILQGSMSAANTAFSADQKPEEQKTLKDTPATVPVYSMMLNISKKILLDPSTYLELASSIEHEIYAHKLGNLQNEFEEFNNQYSAAIKAVSHLTQMQSGLYTAELLATLQAQLGRFQFMETSNYAMTPEVFLAMGTSTGLDQVKRVLGSVSSYVDTKLSLPGYEPARLHYSTNDFDYSWDTSLAYF